MPPHCIQWPGIIIWKIVRERWSVTIHTRNFQTLATEMLKVYRNLSPAIIADLFHVRQNNYNLRHDPYFVISNVKSVYYGRESLSNLGPTIWNLVPDKLKQLVDIHAFKKEIKKWKPENCPCRLCKTYIPHVGFIWSFKFVFVFENTFRSNPPETLLWRVFFAGGRSDMVFL